MVALSYGLEVPGHGQGGGTEGPGIPEVSRCKSLRSRQ